MYKYTEWKNVHGKLKLTNVEVNGYVIDLFEGLTVSYRLFWYRIKLIILFVLCYLLIA